MEAKLHYRKLVKSVGEFLDVPSEELETLVVAEASTDLEVVDW